MSETSETSESHLNDSERGRVLIHIILKSRVAYLLPIASADENDSAVRVWDQILADVPTHWIDRAFVSAMRAAGDLSKPFGAPNVFKAYRTLVANGTVKTTELRQREKHLPETPSCEFCENGPWRYIGPNGEKRLFKDRQDGDRVARCNHAD